MKVVVLASGSRGNATYIEVGNSKILIDIGISYDYLIDKLSKINCCPSDITHILISHTHSDHTKGLKAFLKKNNPIVALTEKMQLDLKLIKYGSIMYYQPKISIDDVDLTMFRTSHDIDDSFAFVINHIDASLVYITDTGYLNLRYFAHLKNKDIYIIESNHDIELLLTGPYPHRLKQRILSDRGHLSNNDCAKYLSKLVGNNTKHVILAHLSAENNHPDIALKTVKKILSKHDISVQVASQTEITTIIEV